MHYKRNPGVIIGQINPQKCPKITPDLEVDQVGVGVVVVGVADKVAVLAAQVVGGEADADGDVVGARLPEVDAVAVAQVRRRRVGKQSLLLKHGNAVSCTFCQSILSTGFFFALFPATQGNGVSKKLSFSVNSLSF